MSDLVHVSLFSGVGGLDLAMERAGIPTRAACEIDKAARGVLADRFPTTHLFHDVKDVTGDELRSLGLDPRRTVLSAGWPCQGNSVAGARGGMDDERSGLWVEVARILAEFRPGWFVGENVPGLLSVAGGRDLATVLGDVARLGYGFAYRVLDARHFGVPQRRRRFVLVGRLGDDGRAPAQVLLEPEGVPGDPAAGITPRPIFARSTRGGAAASGVLGDHAHTLTARHSASEDGTGRGTPVVAFHMTQDPIGGPVAPAMGAKPGGMGVAYVAEHTTSLDTQQGGPDDNAAQGGHLIATFQKVIRPATSDHPDVWEHRDIAATLSPFDLGSDGRAVELVVDPQVIVRRLTPVECERLQGFPDNHTATSNGKPQADSPRYKQMGNAVAVPVFEWVARRIAAVEGDVEAICVECGDDLAAEGLDVCIECAERLGDAVEAGAR